MEIFISLVSPLYYSGSIKLNNKMFKFSKGKLALEKEEASLLRKHPQYGVKWISLDEKAKIEKNEVDSINGEIRKVNALRKDAEEKVVAKDAEIENLKRELEELKRHNKKGEK